MHPLTEQPTYKSLCKTLSDGFSVVKGYARMVNLRWSISSAKARNLCAVLCTSNLCSVACRPCHSRCSTSWPRERPLASADLSTSWRQILVDLVDDPPHANYDRRINRQ